MKNTYYHRFMYNFSRPRVGAWLFTRCACCRKPLRIFGFWAGDHTNCVPF